jgi:hypothetical protein
MRRQGKKQGIYEYYAITIKANGDLRIQPFMGTIYKLMRRARILKKSQQINLFCG